MRESEHRGPPAGDPRPPHQEGELGGRGQGQEDGQAGPRATCPGEGLAQSLELPAQNRGWGGGGAWGRGSPAGREGRLDTHWTGTSLQRQAWWFLGRTRRVGSGLREGRGPCPARSLGALRGWGWLAMRRRSPARCPWGLSTCRLRGPSERALAWLEGGLSFGLEDGQGGSPPGGWRVFSRDAQTAPLPVGHGGGSKG